MRTGKNNKEGREYQIADHRYLDELAVCIGESMEDDLSDVAASFESLMIQ